MQPPGAQQPPPSADNPPVALPLPFARRVDDAVRYVERQSRGGSPRPGNASPNLRPSAYALATSTITAASGATLGQGTITLCSRSGASLTADGPSGLTCYNAGGQVASGTYLSVAWTDGDWETCVAPCS